jgi:large subunit ribosomal protein L35
MPKQKTHSGSKKRFKLTGKGKVKMRHAMTSHNLGKKASKRKRRLSDDVILGGGQAATARKLLGSGKGKR